MPQVPRYDTPQIRDAPVSSARFIENAPEGAFGGGQGLREIGSGFEAINRTVSEIAQAEKKKADHVMGLKARRALNDKQTQLLYGENGKGGALNRFGEDSFGLPDEVPLELQKSIDEIKDGLSEDQKLAFEEHAASTHSETQRKIESHVSAEIGKYDDQETEGFLKSSKEKIARNPFDQDLVKRETQVQLDEIKEYADRKGYPAIWLRVKSEELQSEAHTTVVDRMLEEPGGWEQAQKYYDSHQEFITQKDRERVIKNLNLGVLRGQSQAASDRLVTLGSQGAALAAAEREFKAKPELRDATKERIRTHFDDRKKSMDQAQDAQLEYGARLLRQKGNDLTQLPPGLMNSLNIRGREVLTKLAHGGAAESDMKAYHDLTIAAGNPKTKHLLTQKTGAELQTLFAGTELKEMIKLKSQLLNGDPDAQNKLKKYRTDTQMLTDTMMDNGLNAKKNPEAFSQIRARFTEEAEREQARTGKDLTPEAEQLIVDRLVSKVKTGEFLGYTFKSRVYQLPADQAEFKVQLGDIPGRQRRQIEDVLKANKEVPTPERVIELYQEQLRRGSQRGG